MTTANSVTVRVPLIVRHRPGRKTVVTLGETAADATIRTHADPAMLKAPARAFRWKRMLENGRCSSISEISTAEKIDRGYVGSILRLTLLSPDIIEAILGGRPPPTLGLPTLLKPFPVDWVQQRANWSVATEQPASSRGEVSP